MSWQATAWVSSVEAGGPSGKLLLYALANYADEHGRCWPSDARLMADTELSERAVRDWKRKLEETGLLTVERRRTAGGTFQVDEIRLAMGKEPPANPAGGATGKSCRDHRQMAPEPPANGAVPPTPPYIAEPSKEPSEEPEREGAREAAEGSPAADAAPASIDDPKKFEKRVKRLAQALNWPNWTTSSTDWTVARFAELTDAERADAERRGAAYLAHCGKRALSLGTYFRERKWVDLPAEAIAAADAPAMVAAPAFGGGCCLALYQALLSPPGPLSPPTASERAMIASGAFSEAVIMAEKRKKFGWPKANLLLAAMAHGQGLTMTAEREALAKALTRGVEVGSPLWEEWKACHERRGWPWLPDPGGQKWVSFPAGGPGGLAAFEQAVREAGDDGGGRQAA